MKRLTAMELQRTLRQLVLVGLALAFFVACGEADQDTTETAEAERNEGGETDSLLTIVPALAPAAGGDTGVEGGTEQSSPAASLGEGALEVTDGCVIFRSTEVADRTTTLVWHEGTVTFDETTKSITFTASDGTPTTIRHDDKFRVGGSAANGTVNFIQPPADSCPDDLFLVSSVVALV